MSGFPNSYNDPLYAALAAAAEAKYQMPKGILDAIRQRGERSNANQVSPSGARGPYQFMPATRDAFLKQDHVDAYADPQQATEAAALHLDGDHRRTGSWDTAIGNYIGGPDMRNHGPVTRAYQGRVGSFDGVAPAGKLTASAGVQTAALDPRQADNALNPTGQTEPARVTAPADTGPGPSVPVPASAVPAPTSPKKHGILGALESVFMPAADSRWAAALRGGIWDSQANQQQYKQQAALNQSQLDGSKLKNMIDEAKYKNVLQKGEFTVAGNNLVHYKPDGTAEFIKPPKDPTEKETLLERWQKEADPTIKDMIGRILLGANAPGAAADRQAGAENVARIRAGATLGAAKIRGAGGGGKVKGPPSGFVLD